MFMTGRLKQLIWILPLAIAGLVAVFGWWGNGLLRATIEGELKAQLTATLNANVTALGIWTTNQTRLATSLAEDPDVRTLAESDFSNRRRPAGGISSRSRSWTQFVNDLRPRLAQLGYEVAQLVNTNFIVVANSTRPQWLATCWFRRPHEQVRRTVRHRPAGDHHAVQTGTAGATAGAPEFSGQQRTNDLRRFNRPAAAECRPAPARRCDA